MMGVLSKAVVVMYALTVFADHVGGMESPCDEAAAPL
jgi:hypothetical protein